jgi:hypothetical protein
MNAVYLLIFLAIALTVISIYLELHDLDPGLYEVGAAICWGTLILGAIGSLIL